MTSNLQQMCKELEKCVHCVEDDIQRSLTNIVDTKNEHIVALEKSKDFHFGEILNHLKEIKDHIKVIAQHSQSIQVLDNKKNRSSVDKTYIKKQIENFQKLGVVQKREHKTVRHPEVSSVKCLESWEKILDDDEKNKEILASRKRKDSSRKNKKVLSSTIECFLENLEQISTEETIKEEVFEDSEEEQIQNGQSIEESKDQEIEESEESCDEEDTKPKIVDFIYKKDIAQ